MRRVRGKIKEGHAGTEVVTSRPSRGKNRHGEVMTPIAMNIAVNVICLDDVQMDGAGGKL